MVNQFYFKDFDPSEEIKSVAAAALSAIIKLSPPDSNASAMLEKHADGYRCSVAIYSEKRPYSSSQIRPTPIEAVQAIEEKFKNQLASK